MPVGQMLSRLPGHPDPDGRARYVVLALLGGAPVRLRYGFAGGYQFEGDVQPVAVISDVFDRETRLHGIECADGSLRNFNDAGVHWIAEDRGAGEVWPSIEAWLAMTHNDALAAVYEYRSAAE